MNIVYIATDSYVPLMGISMTSVLMNKKEMQNLDFYICSTDISETHKEQLRQLTEQYGSRIFFIDVSDYASHFEFEFSTSGFHSIVLARLLLADYMPEEVQKVLYLDSDVIVNGDLSELDSVNLKGKAFAAVPELHMPQKEKKNIGLKKEDIYFNCGVMLINLEFWRKNHAAEKFLHYFEKKQGQLLYNDQDILNHCCKGRIEKLSHTFNYNPALYYFPRYFIRNYQPEYDSSSSEYKEIRKSPKMIHFLGEERPWYHGNYSPYRKIYEYYREHSLWSDMEQTYGKEKILFCYHILNCITKICPWFRKWFTEMIGIYYYKIAKKS